MMIAAVAVGLDVAPVKPADFADPDARSVQHQQKSAIPLVGLETQNAVDVGLRQDAFGQAAANGGEPQGAADVEGEVANAVTEGQQGFHRGQDAVAAGGGQGVDVEGIGEALEIGEGHGGQRLPGRGA
jgi:hypothetical protein